VEEDRQSKKIKENSDYDQFEKIISIISTISGFIEILKAFLLRTFV
jgi:hypothetical protein